MIDDIEDRAMHAQYAREALAADNEAEREASKRVDTERRWRDRRRKRVDPGTEVRALARVAGLIK